MREEALFPRDGSGEFLLGAGVVLLFVVFSHLKQQHYSEESWYHSSGVIPVSCRIVVLLQPSR